MNYETIIALGPRPASLFLRQNPLFPPPPLCYLTLGCTGNGLEMDEEQLVAPRLPVKRRRGGQQGNCNASKHGFYSGHLDPAEIRDFWELICKQRVAPEIAIVLVKLASVLQQVPANRRVLGDASALLARWYGAKYRLDVKDRRELKCVVFNILRNYRPGASLGSLSAVLPKRIERASRG